MTAPSIPSVLQEAIRHHQAGRLAEAEALYRQVLALQPGQADALHYLGVIAHQVGRHDLALDWIRQSLAAAPQNPTAHSNLGEALRALRRLDEARASYEQAIALAPQFAEAHNNLGIVHREKGRVDEAVAAFREALRLRPAYADALNNLGTALATRQESAAALAAYRAALQLAPDRAETHNNLGNALKDLGDLDGALAAYDRALTLQPGLAEAHTNRGDALRKLGRLDEALAACRRAVELQPGLALAWNHLGATVSSQCQYADAVSAYRRAIASQPDYPQAYNNLGIALAALGQYDEALENYRTALRQKADCVQSHYNTGLALAAQGRTGEALAAYRRAVDLAPENAAFHSTLISTLLYHAEAGAGPEMAAEQARWNRRFVDPLVAARGPWPNDRDPRRRLRLGYVSPDFRDHVVGRNLRPLFLHHDRRAYEIFVYADVPAPDHQTREFQQHADHWRNIVGESDAAVAERIRRDRVDILVDLSQHTAGNRLPVFARQPAPVQASFAGCPAATGLETIRYRLSDHWLEGKSQDAGYTSQDTGSSSAATPHPASRILQPASLHDHPVSCILRPASLPDHPATSIPQPASPPDHPASCTLQPASLLDSFWCYDPCGATTPVNPLPAGENGAITFGCLNHFCKVNDPVLALWARALGAVPHSRLVLLTSDGSHRRRTRDFLEAHGVAPARVDFVTLQPRLAYLELYHRLDVILDTFPYGGHTTSLDALWMGVPVVTLVGRHPVSRGGWSQLSNLGLRELAAFSEDAFVRLAADLAHDRPRLAQLRATLRPRMEASVLMDAPHFARQIEAAYREMWQEWCAAPARG
jgi:predicted O-linked N-acetylglucosamine transferase (SPINDLY family)